MMKPENRLRVRARLVDGLGQGAISACAAMIAYLPSQALGSKEGFWGAITAISVVQGELKATRTTARDQFTGAAVGGLIGLCLAVGLGQHLWTYAVGVILAMVFCWTANLASASRLAGITVTIILLVPHSGSVQAMAISRVTEVGWGVCVAIATVWCVAHVSGTLAGARGDDQSMS